MLHETVLTTVNTHNSVDLQVSMTSKLKIKIKCTSAAADMDTETITCLKYNTNKVITIKSLNQ